VNTNPIFSVEFSLSPIPGIFKIEKDLRLARQGALSATTLLNSTGLASKLAKLNSNNLKNREIIALSVIGHA